MKVLKIGAVWCSGCLVMRPRWQKVERENSWLKTEYFDYDESPEIAKKYKLDSGKLPAFIFLNKKGEEIDRAQGEISEKEILDLLDKHKNK